MVLMKKPKRYGNTTSVMRDRRETHHRKDCSSCSKNLPCRYQGRFRAAQEVGTTPTLEQLLVWENEALATQYSQRIWLGLIDIDLRRDGTMKILDSQESRLIRDPVTQKAYRLTTWRVRPDYTLEVECEWDTLTETWTGEFW